MLVKLVYKDKKTIFGGVESIFVYDEAQKDKTLCVVFKDGMPKLNFVLEERTENTCLEVCEAYLMNEKGETIERLN